MNIRQIVSLALLCLVAGSPVIGLSAAAAASPPTTASRNAGGANPVPASTPTDPATAQRDQSAARKLLRADRHVRGRISHAPGYAARQSADIHREREAYLRSKAPPQQ